MTCLFLLCLIVICVKISSISAACDDVSKVKYTVLNSINPTEVPLTSDTFKYGQITYVLIHEWLLDAQVEWLVKTKKNLLLKYPNVNIVIVDYGPYANDILYLSNLCTSPYVGMALGDLFIKLNVDTTLVRCTGHSMGAQICGAFARRIIEKGKPKIARITALDAAGPGYDPANLLPVGPRQEHIKKEDAQKVVGIYTNADKLGFGMTLESGYSHISIIVNGGVTQPCPLLPLCVVVNVLNKPLDCVFCGHRYSREIYWRAVDGKKYTITKCDSYDKYQAGLCNANVKFDITEEILDTVTDGTYHIKVNNDYEQVPYNGNIYS